jgi:hypothetical protein
MDNTKTANADRIRSAALGPTPPYSAVLRSWLPYYLDWKAAIALVPPGPGHGALMPLTDTERRMFILFAAEAIE